MNRTEQYPLRLSPHEKGEFEARAKACGLTLADVFRTGGKRYLDELEGAQAEFDAEDETAGAAYECPRPDCSHEFSSSAAVCPVHGRRAVPKS